MKSLVKYLIAAAFVTAGFGANATEYNLGNLPTGYTGFGANFVSGSFLDKINFSLTGESSGSFGAGALNFTVGGAPILNISGLSLALFDSNDNSLASGLDFSLNALSGGNYYLKVSGVANGLGGGVYAGGINVSPVPELDVWSSLTAGLAMLGFMAFRRREMY